MHSRRIPRPRRVIYNVSEEEFAKLDEYCTALDTDRAEYIRQAVERHHAFHEKLLRERGKI